MAPHRHPRRLLARLRGLASVRRGGGTGCRGGGRDGRAGCGRFGLGGDLGHDDRRPGPPGGRGRRVKGGYDGTFGRIEGRVEGGKLVGRFFEDTGSWGEFKFVLEPGGAAFKGRWRRLNVEADDWHECEGTKVKK